MALHCNVINCQYLNRINYCNIEEAQKYDGDK